MNLRFIKNWLLYKILALLLLFGGLFVVIPKSLFMYILLFHILKYSLVSALIFLIFPARWYMVSPKYLFVYPVLFLAAWDTCSWRQFLSSSLIAPKNRGLEPRYFIAGNLCNNEKILPFYIREINKFINQVGRDNVFISIVEDHSIDSTAQILKDWRITLKLKGVGHNVIVGFDMPNRKVDRIEKLAYLRNIALQPFFNPANRFVKKFAGQNFTQSVAASDKVIFINDIIFFKEDVVALLNTNSGKYDAVCATDYDGMFIYDMWVLRDKDGKALSPIYPHFRKTAERTSWTRDEPVPVFSCWNGLVVLNSELVANYFSPNLIPEHPFPQTYPDFTSVAAKGGDFRFKNDTRIRFRAQSFKEECYSSECFYLWVDLRRAHQREKRDISVYINPKVKVSYKFEYYFLWKEVLNWSLFKRIIRIIFDYSDKFPKPTSHQDQDIYECTSVQTGLFYYN